MKDVIELRVQKEASYIINTKETIRNIANIFGMSKSTVHKDLTERLYEIDHKKYILVNKILKYHTKIRHIRGGESTRRKYKMEATNDF